MSSRLREQASSSEPSGKGQDPDPKSISAGGARPPVSAATISARSRALALQTTIMHAMSVGQHGPFDG